MTSTNINSTRVEYLSRDNYDSWSLQVEAILVKADLWGYVSGELVKPEITAGTTNAAATQAAQDLWIKQDRKARADLILCIHPSGLSEIRECTTSHEIWVKLRNIYASTGPACKASLLKQLILQKLSDDGDLRDHLSNFFHTVAKLNEMGVQIER